MQSKTVPYLFGLFTVVDRRSYSNLPFRESETNTSTTIDRRCAKRPFKCSNQALTRTDVCPNEQKKIQKKISSRLQPSSSSSSASSPSTSLAKLICGRNTSERLRSWEAFLLLLLLLNRCPKREWCACVPVCMGEIGNCVDDHQTHARRSSCGFFCVPSASPDCRRTDL